MRSRVLPEIRAGRIPESAAQDQINRPEELGREGRWVVLLPADLFDRFLDKAGQPGTGIVSGLLQCGDGGGCGRPDFAQCPGRTLAKSDVALPGDNADQGVHGCGSFGLQPSEQCCGPIADIGRSIGQKGHQFYHLFNWWWPQLLKGRNSPFRDLVRFVPSSTGQGNGGWSRIGAEVGELLGGLGPLDGISGAEVGCQLSEVGRHGDFHRMD
jgi:hypothetical protein